MRRALDVPHRVPTCVELCRGVHDRSAGSNSSSRARPRSLSGWSSDISIPRVLRHLTRKQYFHTYSTSEPGRARCFRFRNGLKGVPLGPLTISERRYRPSASARRNPVLTSTRSAAALVDASAPHSRCACALVSERPGRYENSSRSRRITSITPIPDVEAKSGPVTNRCMKLYFASIACGCQA